MCFGKALSSDFARALLAPFIPHLHCITYNAEPFHMSRSFTLCGVSFSEVTGFWKLPKNIWRSEYRYYVFLRFSNNNVPTPYINVQGPLFRNLRNNSSVQWNLRSRGSMGSLSSFPGHFYFWGSRGRTRRPGGPGLTFHCHSLVTNEQRRSPNKWLQGCGFSDSELVSEKSALQNLSWERFS